MLNRSTFAKLRSQFNLISFVNWYLLEILVFFIYKKTFLHYCSDIVFYVYSPKIHSNSYGKDNFLQKFIEIAIIMSQLHKSLVNAVRF